VKGKERGKEEVKEGDERRGGKRGWGGRAKR